MVEAAMPDAWSYTTALPQDQDGVLCTMGLDGYVLFCSGVDIRRELCQAAQPILYLAFALVWMLLQLKKIPSLPTTSRPARQMSKPIRPRR